MLESSRKNVTLPSRLTWWSFEFLTNLFLTSSRVAAFFLAFVFFFSDVFMQHILAIVTKIPKRANEIITKNVGVLRTAKGSALGQISQVWVSGT